MFVYGMQYIAVFVDHMHRESLFACGDDRETRLVATIYGALGVIYTSALCGRGVYNVVDVAILVA